MSVPFATWAFGGVATLFLFRGLWNPHRAVVHEAALAACPGPEGPTCNDTLALVAQPGTPVYAAGSGTVMAVGDRWLHIQLSNEPVILHYTGVTPDVAPGQTVGRGRKIGVARDDGPVEFGVTGIVNDNGVPVLHAVEPRSWLAVRGYALTVRKAPPTDLWCGPGRHVTVPPSVHMGCGLLGPEKSNFALLPVSVTEA
jgi:hypothetical protein